jgi:hypothetical protein
MAALESDIEEVEALTRAFVATLKSRDKAFMQSKLLPGFTATLVRNGTILQLEERVFIDRLHWNSKEEVEEVLTSVDVKVRGLSHV